MKSARKATVFTGVLRWIFAALLLASGNTQLLAQRANDLARLAPGTVFRDCAGCPEMVVIPPGEFTPGSADGNGGHMYAEALQRPVAIAPGTGIGKYEVTRAQFARFVKESGYSPGNGCFVWNGKYEQDASKSWRNPGFAQRDNEPVVCVNWSDAKAYADWLTKKSGKAYRLPSEAEWEYAARAGTRTSRPWGDNEADACRYANVADASTKRDLPGTVMWIFHQCNDKRAYTAPVGSYRPNAFGLYDMLGNAWEWTENCLSEEEYAAASSAARDRENGECTQRVLRGGGWVDSPPFVSFDFRFMIGTKDRDFYIGFRVVRAD